MNRSVELRWFFRQHLPEEIKDWFCGSRLCKEEAGRSDLYLVFPGGNHASLKLRGGTRLEIKTRIQMPEPFSLATGASVGRQDAWVKWSHYDSEIAVRLAALEGGSPHWFPVAKKRWLRKFRIGAAGQVEEIDADTMAARGCRIEVSEVNVRGSYWWTLAFESFDEGNRTADLEQVARHFLKMRPQGLVLTERDSMSYPEWLNRITG